MICDPTNAALISVKMYKLILIVLYWAQLSVESSRVLFLPTLRKRSALIGISRRSKDIIYDSFVAA